MHSPFVILVKCIVRHFRPEMLGMRTNLCLCKILGRRKLRYLLIITLQANVVQMDTQVPHLIRLVLLCFVIGRIVVKETRHQLLNGGSLPGTSPRL